MENRVFYFTYGTWEGYPFCGGWVEVHAPTREKAVEYYRKFFPDKTPGIVNCSDIYTQEEFLRSGMVDGNCGHCCYGEVHKGVFEHKLF